MFLLNYFQFLILCKYFYLINFSFTNYKSVIYKYENKIGINLYRCVRINWHKIRPLVCKVTKSIINLSKLVSLTL